MQARELLGQINVTKHVAERAALLFRRHIRHREPLVAPGEA
jgi:hypothetical protein